MNASEAGRQTAAIICQWLGLAPIAAQAMGVTLDECQCGSGGKHLCVTFKARWHVGPQGPEVAPEGRIVVPSPVVPGLAGRGS